MTLDEFIAAVKGRPKGYLEMLAEVSGYHKSHVRRIVNGECTPKEQTLIDLIESIAQADKQQAIRESKTFSYGLPCGYCGNTKRYVANRHCVACARQRTRKYFYKKRGML